MAKALLGYVGTIPDQRLLEELVTLRSRVRRLQLEVEQTRAERDEALARLRVHDLTPADFAEAPLPV